jgi:hypothetical protein
MGKIIGDEAVLLELGLSSSPTDEERAIVQQAVVKAEGAVIKFLGYDPAQRSRTEFYPQMDFTPAAAGGIWEVSDTEAYVRRMSQAASDELQLVHIPIRSSPAIDVRIESDGRFGTKTGSFVASSLKVEGTDFWAQYDGIDSAGNKICNDGILRSFGRWPSEPGSVKIVYTAGYSTAELEGQDLIVDASPIMDAIVEESLRRAKKVLTLWKKNPRTGHNAGVVTSEGLGEYNYSVSGGVLDKLMSSGSLSLESRDKLQPFAIMHLGVV